jgi:hypothetical protein
MSDRLALANAIEDAGIQRDKAQNLASVIVNLVHDTSATKADVQLVQRDISAVRSDLLLAISELKRTMITGGTAALVAAGGILFAALHYWPPHAG